MTAALSIVTRDATDRADPVQVHAAAHATGPAPGGAVPRRRPHLIPVPDCEPPLEAAFAPEPFRTFATPTPAAATPAAATPAPATPAATTAPTSAPARPAGTVPVRPKPPLAAPTAGGSAVEPHPVTALLAPARPPRVSRPVRRAPGPGRTAGDPGRPVPAQRSGGPARRPAFRVATVSAGSVPGWSNETDVGVRMTPTTSLPPARRVAAVLARGLLEALTGCRPLEQLRRHCAPDVFAGLAAAPALGDRGTVRLVTAMVCEPADGVAEVSAVFRSRDHVRAMALRLQGVDGRWRVTALQVG